jgi:6-phosphogluconolactonase (cycloisomerase 2 family)
MTLILENMGGDILSALGASMKRLIGYTVAICLLAIMVGCGGVTSTGTLAYVSNSAGTGFTVFTVNTDGTLTKSSISPQNTPASPRVLQFSANGKWAYFLDTGGANIYAYLRTGDGQLLTLIDSYPTGPQASSLVISPNSSFLYVALPNTQRLATYSIDPGTGILSQVGSPLQLGYSISQLVMAPGGTLLFALAPSQQTVLSLTLNSSSGAPTPVANLSVGIKPSYMIQSANGSFVYVLDSTGTTPVFSLVNGVSVQTGASPNIYGYNVQGSVLSPMPGTSTGGGSVFNENPDQVTGIYPTNPIAGSTTNDNRYLFVANQGSKNISAFKINSTSGELTEVLGSVTTVNGIQVSSASPFACGTGCTTPSFVAIPSANNALYLLDTSASKIFQFAIDQNTGRLRAQNPASVGAETSSSQPTWITIR